MNDLNFGLFDSESDHAAKFRDAIGSIHPD